MSNLSLFIASAEQKQQAATANMVPRKRLINCTLLEERIEIVTAETEVFFICSHSSADGWVGRRTTK